MKIAMLSSASSIHTIRWANGLSQAGHEVHVISQQPAAQTFLKNVTIHQFPERGVLGYFLMVPKVKKLLKTLEPDILNAHYASGYGTVARLVNFSPYLLSVWGSDIFDFPYKSPLHRWIIQKNLLAADALAATSHYLADQTRTLCPDLSEIILTPFGVDSENYRKPKPSREEQDHEQMVIGTVKTLAPRYGIDTLLESFALLKNRLKKENSSQQRSLKLRIVGGGPEKEALEAQSVALGIDGDVEFIGRVPHRQVAEELSKLDVYVALSRSESFGVAIVEAAAAGLPVVVSNVGGLPEVTLHEKTGFVVDKEDPNAACKALYRLIQDPELRQEMGLAGRERIESFYHWPTCIEAMIQAYEKVISQKKNLLKN